MEQRAMSLKDGILTRAVVIALGLVCAGRLVVATAAAQCVGGFQPSHGLPGVDGTVRAMTWWDPDGPGPAPRVLVVAGDFLLAGGRFAPYLAVWDGAAWSAPWPRLSSSVNALLPLPDGRLMVGGSFTSISPTGAPMRYIAVWNPTTSSWSQPGGGLDGPVDALAVRSNGRPVAAGRFSGGLKEFNSDWALTSGGLCSGIKSLAVFPGGDLLVGGAGVRRLGQNGWVPMGAAIAGDVTCMAVGADGSVVVGANVSTGPYTAEGSVYRWNGTAWSAIGDMQFNGRVYAVRLETDGTVVVGGHFQRSGAECDGLAKWSGSAWAPVNEHARYTDMVYAMERTAAGDLIVAGDVYWINDCAVPKIGRIAADGVYALGSGFTDYFESVAALPDGRFVVGSDYAQADGRVIQGPVCGDGVTWTSIGGELYPYDRVSRVWATARGDVLAMSWWSSWIDGVRGLARWDGHSWSRALPDDLEAGCVQPRSDGSLLIGGWRQREDGVYDSVVALVGDDTTTQLGGAVEGDVHVFATMPNGDVIAGGDFTAIGDVAARGIARWDGSRWNAMGAGIGGPSANAYFDVKALLVTPSGKLIVGGSFFGAGDVQSHNVICWDGSAWSGVEYGLGWTIGYEEVRALANLSPAADGSDRFLAGGMFFGSFPTDGVGLAEWDGHRWLTLGVSGTVNAFAPVPGTDAVMIASYPLQIGFTGATDGLTRWSPSQSAPVIVNATTRVEACGDSDFTMAVDVTESSGPCTYQWWNTYGRIESQYAPTAVTPRLTLHTYGVNLREQYWCVVTNACGATSSLAIEVERKTADLVGPGRQNYPDGVFDNNDFIGFIDMFFYPDARADIGGVGGVWGPDGRWDNNDFIVFVNLFFSGC